MVNMKDKLVLTALLSVLAAVSATGAESDDQQERKKLTGVWKGFAVEGRGENPDRGPVKLELTFTERSIKGLEFKGTNVVNHGEGGLHAGSHPKPDDPGCGKSQ
jgi:hypothetical protein